MPYLLMEKRFLENEPRQMKAVRYWKMKAVGISHPPYSTYLQSFNFRSIVLSEISVDKKSITYNHTTPPPDTQLASFTLMHPISSI